MADQLAKHKNKIVNFAVIIVAVIIALNINKKMEEKAQTLKQEGELETKRNQVLTNIRKLERKMDAFKELLPARDASIVMSKLSSLAGDSGVKLLSIKPGNEEKTPDYIKFPFDLTVSAANYNILGKFISAIENYEDVYQVEVVEIRPQDEKKELSANLKVDTIIYVE